MKSRTAAGLAGILIIVSALLIFVFFHDPLNVNLYRLLFSALLDCALCAAILLIYKGRKKMARARFSLYIAGNVMLIVFGFFLLYAVPLLLTQKGIVKLFPPLGGMRLLSPLLSSLLTIDIALFVVLNGVVFGLVSGISARIIAPVMIGVFFLVSLILFLVNSRRFDLYALVRLAYLVASGSLWIVFFLFISGIVTDRKRGKYIGMTVVTVFLTAELLLQFLSWRTLKANLSSPLFHSLLLFLMGGNIFAGFLSYNLPRRKPLMKTLPVQLPLLIAIAVVATAICFAKELEAFLFYATAYSAAAALSTVSACLLLDKKGIKTRKRLTLLSVVFILAAAESVFLLEGVTWMKAPLISMSTIGMFAVFIVLGVAYIVFTGRRADDQKKKTAEKKKAAASRRIDPPFEAYKGQGKFIFVSYSHRDMEKVFSICHKLFNDGFRIWYDEGIEPGREWPETIGKAIESCGQFLIFASPSAVGSRNVRNEINYALARHKEIIVVMLKKTKLTYGLELQIGTVQAIHEFEMNEKDFFKRMHAILKK
jgi:hypothetical protein